MGFPRRCGLISGPVRDENNRKDEQSRANGIDPLPLIERLRAGRLPCAHTRCRRPAQASRRL